MKMLGVDVTTVGLLFVGAVLFVNGISLLGGITPRGAAPMNIFVGAMQVVLPTIALVRAGTDMDVIFSVAPLYLFGFTYLYVGWNSLADNDGSGLGWFSIFVCVMAVVWGSYAIGPDPAFAAIWFVWALMWLLFFLVLALNMAHLTSFAGWLLVIGSHLTATIPALMLMQGGWRTDSGFGLLGGVLAVVIVLVSAGLAKSGIGLPSNAQTQPNES